MSSAGRRYRFLVVGVILLAFVLRLYRFAELPPGLFSDEAYNALDGLAVLNDGYHPLFFERNNGREPFYIYFQSLFLLVAGTEPFIVRLPSVVLGTLTVALSYPLFIRLLSDQDERRRQLIALFGAFLLATMQFHLNFSRVGFRAIAQPLFEALAIYLFYRGAQLAGQNRRRWSLCFAMAGSALGMAAYTYISSRLLPVAVLLLIGLAVVWGQRLTRRYVVGLAATLAVAAVIAAPLGLYYLQHPDVFTGHSQDVSLLNSGGLVTLGDNLIRVAGMFNWAGDVNWRHNLAGRPVFDAAVGLFFLVGVFVVALRLRRAWRRPTVLPNGYLAPVVLIPVMLLPTILSEGAPQFLRAIGTLPFLALIPAIGLESTYRRLVEVTSRRTSTRWANSGALHTSPAIPYLRDGPVAPVGNAVSVRDARGAKNAVFGLRVFVALVLAFALAATVKSYFVDWANDEGPYYYFDMPYIEFARYVNAQDPDTRVYLSPWLADHATNRLYLRDHPYAGFDSQRTIVLTSKEALYAFQEGGVDMKTAAAFPDKVPADMELVHLRDSKGRPAFGFYRLAASSSPLGSGITATLPASLRSLQQPNASAAQPLVFGDELSVLGLALDGTEAPRASTLDVTAGITIPVTVSWRLERDVSDDYTISLRLVDGNGRGWAQSDSLVGGRMHPSSSWQLDEVVVDTVPMVVPPDLPPGVYRLAAGAYSLLTKRALEAKIAGQPKGQLAQVVSLRVGQPAKGALAAMRPPRALGARLGSELTLLGYGLGRDSLKAGEPFDLDLYWVAEGDVSGDLAFDLIVRDVKGHTVAEKRGTALNDVYPTSRWRAGDAIQTPTSLVVSPKASAGPSSIVLTLVDKTTGASQGSVDLRGPDLRERERRFSSAQPMFRKAARFDDKIELVGFDVVARAAVGPDLPQLTVTPPGPLAVTLIWRAVAEMPTSYTVFTQLLDSEGRLVAQHDGLPQEGAALTSTWLPDEVVADSHNIALKAELAAGEYTLIAGLYNAFDGRRLPVGQGDFVRLAAVQITNN